MNADKLVQGILPDQNSSRDIVFAVGILVILALLFLPLPTLLIDFGLAHKIIDGEGKHIKYEDNKSFLGNAKFASIDTHFGITQGRRDDL